MTEPIGPFRKSSHSGQEGNCVEVAATAGGGRAVRDSKKRNGPLLSVTRKGWQSFIAAAQSGEFGHFNHQG
ncbi:DUF397 domain-containing protein [Streptomyces sp. NBC_01340]|uniref:DUF397 domain-containing protein n=1 Tax=unclassified Streptomyces TaxID=2593676 RepID=UPI0022517A2D|nr:MULTISPECIES: DUF397 domain-containing protein [unclassified Streptomyces]MCX4454951.1 DUF397 domain-containing protein [Streptomyces sp. NBC_01719]MCX4494311.1 DUF397 domain-containing protein [Streptomyces sp. NBC_01728]WSI39361.1 DUF397 domain-containing protein [Streptomyces sp. NBC_01340]